jgi:hypothetical protein
VAGSGYDAVLPVACHFDAVPVNMYAAEATVGGGYYRGSGEGVITIFDPSLGFTTGGGWFTWPGSAEPGTGYPGDRTNLGYTAKYNKNGTRLQGNLLLIRHLPDGSSYRVKISAQSGLALGEDPGVPMGWAIFSGQCTYREPGWSQYSGNYTFVVYVEDRGEPGTSVDRIWIEIKDAEGQIVPVMSMAREAITHTVTLSGGNLVVPHTRGRREKGGKPAGRGLAFSALAP